MWYDKLSNARFHLSVISTPPYLCKPISAAAPTADMASNYSVLSSNLLAVLPRS